MANTVGMSEGMVIAFDSDSLPTPDWAQCDGTGGTPNLQDKHIMVAGDSYGLGDTGGSSTHRHWYSGGSLNLRFLTSGYPLVIKSTYPSGTNVPGGPAFLTPGYTPGFNNLPYHWALHYLRAMKQAIGIPVNGVVWWAGSVDDIPPDWSLHTDLIDRFCVATGLTFSLGDNGGAHWHSHTFSCGGPFGPIAAGPIMGGVAPKTLATTGNWSGNGGSDTGDMLPMFYGLLPIKASKTSGIYTGMVVFYDGDMGDLPVGEFTTIADAMDRLLIGAGNLYNVGDMGGNTSHAHLGGCGGGGSLGSGSAITTGSHPQTWMNRVTISGVNVVFSSADHMPEWYALHLLLKT